MTKIHKYFRAGLLLLLCRLQVVLASPPGTAVSHPVQEPSEVTPLELDKPIERELSAAQKHTYQLTLSEKHYVKVVVEQRGIDVVVRLFGPGDKRILDIDGESRLQGHEILEWVVNQTGPYKIEIAPRYKSVPAGRYQIRLGEMRTVTEQDMSLDQARLLHAQARREFQAGKTNEASHIEEQVLRIREQVLEPEHLDVAAALFALGLYQRNDGEIPKAEASYLRALAIREKALPPDHPDISFVLHNLGYLYYSDLRDYVRAQSFYER